MTMRQINVSQDEGENTTFPSRDSGFYAIKGIRTEAGERVIVINLFIDRNTFNWSHHRLLYAYLCSAKREMMKGERIEVIWFHDFGDEESCEMGKDYAALFDMTFIYREHS